MTHVGMHIQMFLCLYVSLSAAQGVIFMGMLSGFHNGQPGFVAVHGSIDNGAISDWRAPSPQVPWEAMLD